MSINNTLVKTTLLLDGKEPKQVLTDLSTKAQTLEKKIGEALSAGDTKALKQYYKELQAVEKQTNQIKNATFEVEKVLKNLNGSSMKELKKASAELNRELDKMAPNTKEFIEKSKQLTQVKGRISELNVQMKGLDTTHKSFFSRASDGFNKYFGILTAFAATFTGIVFGVRKAIDMFSQFEERVDNLSALTGLEGEQLKWLSDEAKKASVSTVEGNIKIKQSADAIVDAYTKVGSQRPELLKNKEALAAVTQDAIILSEAAKTELQPAVDGLTMAMNQLGLGADQSRRIINVMAAGSKAGSADIPYLTEAMEKSGTTARLMGINIEQLTGAIEAVAPSYSRAEMAGNSFDKVLLKMKAKGIGYKDGVFDLNRAVAELEQRFSKGETAAELFGVEHSKMGELLVLNKNEIVKYTDAVTGTQVALEQASKNTNNHAAELAQAKNKAALYSIELGEKLAPAFTFSTNALAKFLKLLSSSIDFYVKNAKVINGLVLTIGTYTAANKIAWLVEQTRIKDSWTYLAIQKLKTYWNKIETAGTIMAATATALFTGKLKEARAGMSLLMKSMNTNIWALIATAVVALGYAMYELSQKETLAAKQAKILLNIQSEVKKGVVEEKLELTKLLIVARDKNKSDEERQKAIKKLNEISPEFLGNLTKENILTDEGTKAINTYIGSLERKMRVQVISKKIEDEQNKQTDISNSALEEHVEWYEQAWAMATNFLGTNSMINYSMDIGTKATKNKTSALKDQKKILEDLMNELKKAINEESNFNSLNLKDPKPPKPPTDPDKSYVDAHNKLLAETLEARAKLNESLKILREENSKSAYLTDITDANKKLEILKKQEEDDIEFKKNEYERLKDSFDKGEIGREQYYAKIKELDDQALNDRLENIRKEFDGQISILQAGLDAYSKVNTAIKDKEDKKLEDIKENNDAQKDHLQKMYDEGVISKEQYDSKVANIDKKFDAQQKQLQNEQARREEQLALFQQSLATAIAIANAIKLVFSSSKNVYEAIVAGIAAVGEVISLMVYASKYQQKAPQFATGNLDVIGASDGKKYNARYVKNTPTGYYTQPTFTGSSLFAEKEPEIYVDGPTTRNIMMNYPGIFEAIQAVRVPQYATGNVPEKQATNNNGLNHDYGAINPNIISLFEKLSKQLDQPLMAYTVLQQQQTKEQLLIDIENTVRR